MYQRVKEYIRRYHMLDGKDRVITGVSGGADSICLLFMLSKMSLESGFTIVAVHVHHGLRGDAADGDAAYVEDICRELGIKLRTFHEDVQGYARKKGLTLEEAGRDVRRRIFEKVLEQEKGTRIALAHHQNDNAETLVLNLCRGCGLRGLGGIAPIAGAWIHPLLCLKREDEDDRVDMSFAAEAEKLPLERSIELRDITYAYPNTEKLIFDHAELEIAIGSAVGIVGTSGAGKSTIVDVLLGLLEVRSGAIYADGVDVKMIFMLDDTIRRNVAFGVHDQDIDEERIWEVLREAQ